MIKYLWQKKYIVFFLTALYVISLTSFDFLVTYNQRTMTLSLSYPDVADGLNPDGTRFNVFELTTPEVLDKVVEKVEIPNMTVDNLKKRISIFTAADGGIVGRVRNSIVVGEELNYTPNEYRIMYTQKDKLAKNHTEKLLHALAESYKEYFKYKYTEKNTVLTYEPEDYSDYEYIEIADVLTYKVDSMRSYISAHNAENGTFRSTHTKQTFENILVMLDNLRAIEIEKYRAFVVNSSLTRDAAAYVQKLNYTNSMFTVDYNKLNYQTNFITGAITQYDARITGVVFIPSLDASNEFYMSRTKIGLDYLTEDAYNVGIEAEEKRKQIANNNYLINMLKAPPSDAAEKVRVVQVAENMIKSITSTLETISKVAIETDNDYLDYKTSEYLKFDIATPGLSSYLRVKDIAMTAIKGVILSCLLLFFIKRFMEWRAKKA